MPLYYDSHNKNVKSTFPPNLLHKILILNPRIALIYSLMNKFFQPGSLKGQDADNIKTIIQAGRHNNVDEMEIELENQVVQGLDLKALESLGGVYAIFGQKGKSTYKLKIKYK